MNAGKKVLECGDCHSTCALKDVEGTESSIVCYLQCLRLYVLETAAVVRHIQSRHLSYVNPLEKVLKLLTYVMVNEQK